MSKMPEPTQQSSLSDEQLDGISAHEKAEHLPALPAGPFTRLANGEIFAVAEKPLKGFLSADEGATWEEQAILPGDESFAVAPTGALLAAASGAVVLGFSNMGERHSTWSDDLRDAPGARLPAYAMRSLDGGRTWQDVQKLHEDWTGATRDIIQTRDGRIIFTSMRMQHRPGRHSVLTYSSDDDGQTWSPSNVVDLGGNGHHDGLTEGTIVELLDGRILQYARTNWGQFWRLESHDGGLSWHPYGPSGVEAGSAPGMLKRLGSGRIALVWNRPTSEDGSECPIRGGDGIWSAAPASNYRKELSISFSDDECETWSAPLVAARCPGREVSYPYIFEPEPGVLWITAHRWGLRMRLREEDFAG